MAFKFSSTWYATASILIEAMLLCDMLDFKRCRSQSYESLSREVDFMGWFPVAFLINGAFVKHVGFELTTAVL